MWPYFFILRSFEKNMGDFVFLAILGDFVLELPRISNKTTENSQNQKINHNFFNWPQNKKVRPHYFLQFLKIKRIGYFKFKFEAILLALYQICLFQLFIEGTLFNFRKRKIGYEAYKMASNLNLK